MGHIPGFMASVFVTVLPVGDDVSDGDMLIFALVLNAVADTTQLLLVVTSCCHQPAVSLSS